MKHFLHSITLDPWTGLTILYAAVLVGWAGPEWFAIPCDTAAPLSAALSCTAGINAMLALYFQFNNGISK
jgi:hypothetical protein